MENEKFPITSSYPLAYYKGYINVVVYYNHQTFRYSLAKVPKDSYLEKTRKLKATPSLPDAKEVADEINHKIGLFERAYQLLQQDEGRKDTLRKRDIDEKIVELRIAGKVTTKVNASHSDVNESVVNDYGAWLQKRMNERKECDNRKDCMSTYRLLQDYQYDLGCTIKYTDIDDSFIDDLIDYCYDKRENTDEHHYLTMGGMCNKTINKRLDCFFQFLRKNHRMPEFERKHKLDVEPKYIVRLDPNEITMLMNLDIDDPTLEYARDCLVFLCLTGLRYGDFAKLDRTYIKGDHIVLNTNKTKKGCRIRLFEYAKMIGEKYDYKFNPPCNFVLNKQIHSLLVKYDLFPEEITTSYLAKDRVVVRKPKRDYITCHTGRRSFISMLAEDGDIDLIDIMSATGHTTVKMVQVYIDLFGKRRDEKFANFDKKYFANHEQAN